MKASRNVVFGGLVSGGEKNMLKDLLLQNRSYRGFDESRTITREELMELVEMARYTASASNAQTLKYALVWEKEQAETVLGMTAWAGFLKELHLPLPGKHPMAYIVICHDTSVHPSATAFQIDVGIAAQTLLLAAVEKGLGGCIIGSFQRKKLQQELGLDARFEPQLVIALGKPDEKIEITDVGQDGSTRYYRDAQGTHFVPKRKLEDLLLP